MTNSVAEIADNEALFVIGSNTTENHPIIALRMKEAVLGLLAGDIYGSTPLGASLALFKGLYWLNSLRTPRRSLAAWRRRRRLIADGGALRGENVMSVGQ